MLTGSLRESKKYALPEQQMLSTRRSKDSERNISLAMQSEEDNKNTSSSSKRRRAPLGWWGEVASFALALSCTSLILAILIFIYNKPLESWPLSIQPNSLVAVFSTITKSALLYPVAECLGQLKWHHFEKTRTLSQMDVFDQASRGPWGSLKFIFAVKGWVHLASLGSLITVLMLGFEPFTQQVIQFSSRRTSVHNMTGYITQAPSFSVEYTLAGKSRGAFALDTGLQAVIAQVPMIDNQPMGISNKYCPGLRCEYPSFMTLASCWHCEAKRYSTQSLDCSGEFLWQNGTSTTFDSGSQLKEQVKFFLEAMPYQMDMTCSKTVHGFPTIPIKMTIDFDSANINSTQRVTSAYLKPGRDSNFVGTEQVWLKSSDLHKNNTSFLRGCGSFENRTQEAAPPRYSSWTCIHSWTDLSLYSFENGQGAIDVDSFGQLDVNIDQCSLELCAQSYSNTSQAYDDSFPLQLDSHDDGRSFSIPQNVTYSLDNLTTPLSGPSASSLNDTNIVTFPLYVPRRDRGPFAVQDVAYMRLQEGLRRLTNISDDFVEANFFADFNGDFGPLFNDLSNVITRYIHSDWNTQRNNVTGVVFATTVYADVRFVWLVMPLLTILMAILFFTTTVLRDRRRAYLYKTSLLPVLLHGLEGVADGVETDGQGDKETYDALMRTARKIRVRLERNEVGVLKLKGE